MTLCTKWKKDSSADNTQKSNYKSHFLKWHLCCIFLLSFRPHSCCGRHGLSEPLVLMWGLAVWRPVEGVHEHSETLGGGLHRSRHQTGLLLWWSGEWTEETSVGENRNSKCGWRFFLPPLLLQRTVLNVVTFMLSYTFCYDAKNDSAP